MQIPGPSAPGLLSARFDSVHCHSRENLRGELCLRVLVHNGLQTATLSGFVWRHVHSSMPHMTCATEHTLALCDYHCRLPLLPECSPSQASLSLFFMGECWKPQLLADAYECGTSWEPRLTMADQRLPRQSHVYLWAVPGSGRCASWRLLVCNSLV